MRSRHPKSQPLEDASETRGFNGIIQVVTAVRVVMKPTESRHLVDAYTSRNAERGTDVVRRKDAMLVVGERAGVLVEILLAEKGYLSAGNSNQQQRTCLVVEAAEGAQVPRVAETEKDSRYRVDCCHGYAQSAGEIGKAATPAQHAL